MDYVRTPSMRIAKVAGLDNDKRGSFVVVVVVDKIDRTWLCSCNFVIMMSDHPSPTGSPPIPSSSVDSYLLSPPTSGPVPSQHQTARSHHPKMCPSRPVLTYRTRHLANTGSATLLRHMTGILPITVSHRRPVVCLWARCRPNNS
jgi:hypothetical protein